MGWLRDVQFAVRILIKNRWFTLMAAVVLALGIGANNAVFTLVNAVLLRGLPFPESDRIGLAGAFGVGKLLEGFLVQMSSRDPVTLATITALLIVVAMVACLWPARYATRLDPLAALRHE